LELTTLVAIGNDCIGSCKSNYHTITTTPIIIIYSRLKEERKSSIFLFLFQFFQKELPQKYEQEPERLFQAAYYVKYNAKKMKK
jgi:hypothetical protein